MDNKFFNDYFDDDNDDELFDEEEYPEDDRRNNGKNGKTFTKGFVTALSICAVAIGAALWTTVNNVNSYLNPEVIMYESSDTDRDDSALTSSSDIIYEADDAQVNALVDPSKEKKNDKNADENEEKKDEDVVFTSEPLKNRKIIAQYSEEPVYNETLGDYRAHPGIDYEAEIDDKVRAMGSGVVKDIYYDDMYGNVVVIKHSDTIESYYCGLAQTALVQMGEVVSAGDFIGTVYAIPCETAQSSHVHVAVKEKGKWINPLYKFESRS